MDILWCWQRVWLLLFVGVVAFDAFGVEAVANGRFQFTQAVYSTTEDFGVAYVTVQRSLGSDGRAAVYVSTIPGMGTALAGRDYKPIFNTSLVWQDGEDFEKALYVPIYNDGKPQETAKTFTLKLHDAIGAEINVDRSQTQVVLVPPSNQITVTEGSILTIPVLWVSGTTSTASVKFKIDCISACSPGDFELVSPLTQLIEWKRDDFPADMTTRTQNIVFKIIDDEVYEPAKTFVISLVVVDVAEAATIGTGAIGAIGKLDVIIDGPNDARSGTLQFDAECFPDCASTKYSMLAGGTALVLIQRRSGSDRDCSVTVATQDNTALAGLDYEPLEQTLSWKEGDVSDRQIIVRSLPRADPRLAARRVMLVLRDNKGAPINRAHASTTYVEITSLTNIFLGDINFAAQEPLESVLRIPDLSFIELASRNTSSRLQLCPSVVATEPGVLSVAIQRNFAPFPIPARAMVKTVAGTATPGIDYEPLTSTSVTWPDGDSEVKHILLKLLTPPSYDPRPRSFWLQLSDVTGAIVGNCNVLEVVLVRLAQAPHVESFDLDMSLGFLTLRLSHPVQASTLDVSKLLLQSERELKNGPTFKFSAIHTTTASLDGSTIVLNVGAGDLNALKRTVGLASSPASAYLSVEAGLFRYVLNKCESSGVLACTAEKTTSTPKTAALAVSTFTADSVSPALVGYSLDLPRRLLKLHFSEAVNFATLQIEALTFSETAAGIDTYRLSPATTRLFLPQPDPLSGATLRDANRLPADNTFLTLQLGRTDVTALNGFGTGQIGITRANTFLGLDSTFITDFAGNRVASVRQPGKMLQQVLCQRSPMWKRLQMRSPFSCPQPGQQFKSREEQLQRAKSNRCGSGRCSCVATGIPGNSNPNGEGFPDDPRCTGPVAYNIIV
ncbi:unnamed protein product [Phytophthora lilii]|uniref:Unnamed protein product n=1 Tax=Phytophthora lilii TaxID=2077276 RepID=A0A9W6UBA7_9STRA|nr:unnamed protein product [Phytophthora lilii]